MIIRYCTRFLCLLTLLSNTVLAQSPILIEDANNLPLGMDKGSLSVAINGVHYLSLDDGTLGAELWRTDGTAGGTFLVADINPGSKSSSPTILGNIGNDVFFIARDGINARALYKTNGNSGNLTFIAGIATGDETVSLGFTSGTIKTITAGARIFLSGTDTVNGAEPWISDGTTSGTFLLKNIDTGSSSSFPSFFDVVNGVLLFKASNSSKGSELWSTDGTTLGTNLFLDINPNSSSSSPTNLGLLNSGLLLFIANDGVNGRELWKSDGTVAGTQLVKNISTGNLSTSFGSQLLGVIGGAAFFSANDSVIGSELWKSDGSTAGTVLVKDIESGENSSSPSNGRVLGTNIIFTASNTSFGNELYKTDGTSGGTVVIKDISTGTRSSSPTALEIVGSEIYFSADNGINGAELFKTNGAVGNATLVVDLNTGLLNASPSSLRVNGSNFLFFALNGLNRSLYKSNGTAAGTVVVKNMNFPGKNSNSDIFGFLTIGDLPCYNANRVDVNQSFRCFDSSTNSVIKVKDFFSVSSGFIPSFLGGKAILTANFRGAGIGQASGSELWLSDFTEQGTTFIKDIVSGTSGVDTFSYAELNGQVLFIGRDQILTEQTLYRTDGTANGTFKVKDLNPLGSDATFNSPLVALNNKVIFFGTDDSNDGFDLWVSDGTANGTIELLDINPFGQSSPANPFVFNGKLYFSANDGINGAELWATDGTVSGTMMVADINPTGSSSPDIFIANSAVLFISADGGNGAGRELWKSDGTAAGTVMVKDVRPGSISSNIDTGFETASKPLSNGLIAFIADDGLHGDELWISDGSADGTFMLLDITVGDDTNFNFVTPIGNHYYFAPDIFPRELWRTDGSSNNTLPIHIASNNFIELFSASSLNNSLITVLDDAVFGSEPHRFTDNCPNDNSKLEPGLCGCGIEDNDSDLDGLADCADSCPFDNQKTVPGVCGCNVSDFDSDLDGIANCNDSCESDSAKSAPGVCGCGVLDQDSDADGVFNCQESCPLSSIKTAPGVCGCDLADSDLNANGVIDCLRGEELKNRLLLLQTKVKAFKALKSTKASKTQKALKAEITALLAEIGGIAAENNTFLTFKDGAVAFNTLINKAKKGINKVIVLKPTTDFIANRKKAIKLIEQLLVKIQ